MNEQQKIVSAFRAAELILKYLTGILTDEEQMELDNWIEYSDSNRKLFSDLTNPARLRPQVNEYEKLNEKSPDHSSEGT